MKQHRDPVTGDALSLGEWVSWLIQGVIRRWAFLVVVTLITLLVWSTNNSAALLWWNLCASYLAIVIESIVGIAMFSQTKRDAVLIRKIERQEEYITMLLEKGEGQEALIVDLLESMKRHTGMLQSLQGRKRRSAGEP